MSARSLLGLCYHKAMAGWRRSAGRPASAGACALGRAAAAVPGLVALLLVGALVRPAAGFDLQAHRAGRGLAPENTLAAVERALALGVTTLELDLVASRDDVLFLGHDLELDPAKVRTPDGRWLRPPGPAVRALAAAELEALDVGRLDPASGYARQWPEQRPVDGERMPTLDALARLLEARGARTIRLNLETKIRPDRPELAPAPERFAELLVAVLRRLDLLDRSTVQSFDWRTLVAVRAIAPDVPTACLTVRQRRFDNLADGSWTAGLRLAEHGDSVPRLVAAAGCRIWSPFLAELEPLDIRRAENLGLRVIPWTVNEPADMRRLVGQGVHGLITDYPDRLRAVLAELGVPRPPALPRAER
ncbi:MAG: glycerophosphodiester phosphodiesterase [Geminicoccaceae bacterium]|nr:glycerophosphodiester phosphodiesterase [Geminicoccaceae bacterium]